MNPEIFDIYTADTPEEGCKIAGDALHENEPFDCIFIDMDVELSKDSDNFRLGSSLLDQAGKDSENICEEIHQLYDKTAEAEKRPSTKKSISKRISQAITVPVELSWQLTLQALL